MKRRNYTNVAPILLMAIMMTTASVYAQQANTKKQPIHGLVTMGNIGALMRKGGHASNSLREAYAHPGVYRGVVLLFGWSELEPTEGKLDATRIRTALDAVRAYNRKYPSTPVVAKIRIFSGWNTPDWVLAKSGGSLTLTHPKLGEMQVGHFWSAPYRKAWRQFQGLLADQYDDDPLVGEVAVSSCATITAEPFILPMNAQNREALYAAGFTDSKHKSCLLGAVKDYSAWKKTPIDYTVNPIRITDNHKNTLDVEFVYKVLEKFRREYGSRGVIANHGLQPKLFPRDVLICAALKRMGPPIEFQTINPHVDWPASIALGLQYGATEIEIWNTVQAGGSARISYAELQQWSKEMQGNN